MIKAFTSTDPIGSWRAHAVCAGVDVGVVRSFAWRSLGGGFPFSESAVRWDLELEPDQVARYDQRPQHFASTNDQVVVTLEQFGAGGWVEQLRDVLEHAHEEPRRYDSRLVSERVLMLTTLVFHGARVCRTALTGGLGPVC